MTKEEWKRVEETLKGFYHTVYLKVDGYDVAICLERVGVYKNMIMIYIGGQFQGKWLAADCEERRRFCQRKMHSLLNAKEKASFRKFPKRVQKELAEKHHNFQCESYSPQWSSFGALKKHLIANNQSVELMKIS